MIRLHTLGSPHVSADDGSVVTRVLALPKPLALLSYLVVANPAGIHRREKLLGLFWPEHDDKHARWALNQTIRRLRAEMGASVIESVGVDAITVTRDLLWCDALAFQEAYNTEDWSTAAELYRGEFLDGLHVAGCEELAEWMDSERLRLRRLAAHASGLLAERLQAAGVLDQAIESARTAVRFAPEDESATRRLIALLDAYGDRAGAVKVYEQYAGWLKENLDVAPAPETVASIRAVKSRLVAAPAVSSPEVGGWPAQEARISAQQPDSDVTARSIETSGGRYARVARRTRSWVGIAAATGAVLLLAGATRWWSGAADSWAASELTRSIRSIAVLPLSNQTRNPEEDYFVEGMHDALIAELSKIGALKVVSVSSAVDRSARRLPSEIARELRVDGLITGSVLREGNDVRITVHLIHAGTGSHVLAETFEGDLRELLRLQSDVARAVADELRVKLTGHEERLLAPRGPLNPEAHQAYLKGRHHLGKGTPEGLQDARDYFRQSADFDPTYAPAYAGLADVYNRLAISGVRPPRDVYPLARAALTKALGLDETLPDAHALSGVVRFRFEWDWKGAERELKRALDLEPRNARAHLGYGMYLLVTGRPDEALASSRRFQDLDPLSPFARQNLAFHLGHNRRYDEAASFLRSAIDLGGPSGVTYSVLAQIYATHNVPTEAVSACETALRLAAHDVSVVSGCGRVYVAAGRHSKARELLETLQVRSSGAGYVDAYHVASLAASVDDSPAGRERTIQWLARAYEERSANLCAVRVNPAFERVSRDPRVQDLVRRMGFPK